jgi:ectoine hydroxylase
MIETPTDTQRDLYPSRVEGEARLIARKDPVVYGAPVDEPSPLDARQLVSYQRRGFLFLPGFFNADEVHACATQLDQVRNDARVKRRPEAIVERGSDDLRSLFAVHKISPFFAKVAADRRLVSMVRQILGSDAYVHQSRVNLKPGFVGKEFYWHSDFETWHVEDGMPRMRAVSCSVLLTAGHAHNGPLMLVPGSHHHYVTCVGRTPENHYTTSLKRQEYGVPSTRMLSELVAQGGIEAPTGPAGSVLLFDCNTMHGSNSNISPFPRTNVFFVYNSVENRLAAPFCGLPPRPGYIACRDPHERIPV